MKKMIAVIIIATAFCFSFLAGTRYGEFSVLEKSEMSVKEVYDGHEIDIVYGGNLYVNFAD